MKKIAVLGSGTWGTAISLLLCKENDVTLWSWQKEESENLRKTRHNPFLLGVTLPLELNFSYNMKEAVEGADIIVTAAPSHAIRNTARELAAYYREGQIIVNISKGIEQGTLLTLSGVIKEEIKNATVVSLSGPSHAEEVARGVSTANVCACENMDAANTVQDVFMTKNFRIYTNPDVLGVELGGSLKNVIALAAGICDGLSCGDNTKAALMTRGLTEITRLGVKMGADERTFSGLTGIGDLIVTCTSMHSRNRRAGILIG